MANQDQQPHPERLTGLELPPPEEVERALDLGREEPDSLPGLYRLNVVRTPTMRLVGFNLFLAVAFLHNLLLRGGVDGGEALRLVLAIETYALGSWLLLWAFFTRIGWLHLGTVFLVADLFVMNLVILFTGGTESLLWPVYVIRVADQLFVGRARAWGMLVAALVAYGTLLGYLTLSPGPEVAWGTEIIKLGALAGLGVYLVLAATIPWKLQEKAHKARDMILRLEEQTLALNQARQRAEEASRAKTEFLARMSHELRTPLNSVIGFTGVLSRSGALGEHSRDAEYLRRIRENGVHLLALINDILDISRIEEGAIHLDWAQVDLRSLVKGTVAQLEGSRTTHDVSLDMGFPGGELKVRADEARLRQVLINLVGNALKFTDEGSVRVWVELYPETRVPGALHVQDTGIGIPVDRLDKIFSAFEQVDGSTRRRHTGTGLGLAISRALCEIMGFDLRVQSEVGKGSTFTILFNQQESPGEEAFAGAEPVSEREDG